MPFKQHPTDPDKMVWVPPQYNLMWPKREWVGLTHDEWQALYVHHHDTSGHTDTQWGYEFAIQAKLKEKNS